MKKWIAIFLLIPMMLGMCSCTPNKTDGLDAEPRLSQMRAISELAVLKCYYHNVAKYYEKNVEGILWWQKDLHFWIEYSGIVEFGIDASLVKLTLDGDAVTVTLPKAKILSCKVDSATLTKDSFIVAADSAELTAEAEIKAFTEAQQRMEQTALADSALLNTAQERVQMLLEKYITNIASAAGKNYTITWIYLDADGNILSDNNN